MSSIKIIRSQKSILSDYFYQYRAKSPEQILVLDSGILEGTIGFPEHWSGFRKLYAQFWSYLGSEKFMSIVGLHRVAASLLLNQIEKGLSEDEKTQRNELLANIESNLSHNHFIQEPFFIALRDFFLSLIESFEGTILVPNLEEVDASSITLLLKSYQYFADKNIHLIIGLDEKYNDNWYHHTITNTTLNFEEEGLLWEYTELAIKNIVFTCLVKQGHIQDISAKDYTFSGRPAYFNVFFDELDDPVGSKLYRKIAGRRPIN